MLRNPTHEVGGFVLDAVASLEPKPRLREPAWLAHASELASSKGMNLKKERKTSKTKKVSVETAKTRTKGWLNEFHGFNLLNQNWRSAAATMVSSSSSPHIAPPRDKSIKSGVKVICKSTAFLSRLPPACEGSLSPCHPCAPRRT